MGTALSRYDRGHLCVLRSMVIIATRGVARSTDPRVIADAEDHSLRIKCSVLSLKILEWAPG